MSIPCEFKSFGCRVEIHFKDKEMVSWNVVISIDQRFLFFVRKNKALRNFLSRYDKCHPFLKHSLFSLDRPL
jgi:hypothetical protein